MSVTSDLRRAWAPESPGGTRNPCDFTKRTVTMWTGATLSGLNHLVYDAFRGLDAIMQAHNYAPRVNRPGAWETGAFNCRKITGGSGFSLHAYGIAADINARTNPYGKRLITDMPAVMVATIKNIKTMEGRNVFRWGGDFRTNKDAMHYEVVLTPNQIKKGIDWDTVPLDPPNPNDPRTWRTIHRGDAGPAVDRLKEALVSAGFRQLEKGRTFGSRTDEAVRRYQRSRGLEVDGWVGPATWTALLHAMPRQQPGDPSPFKTTSQPAKQRPTIPNRLRSRRNDPDYKSAVEEMQRRLVDDGFDPGPIDGFWGPLTKAAVVAFQKSHHLEVDAICGPRTWASLLS